MVRSATIAARIGTMSYTRWHSAVRRMNRSPMRSVARLAYGSAMTDGSGRNLSKNSSVTVEAAARLVNVDVATIEHWSEVGSIEIEQRGDMDVVRLDQVRQLSDSSRVGARTRHGSLRALLRDAEPIESPSVVGLQELVRAKSGDAS